VEGVRRPKVGVKKPLRQSDKVGINIVVLEKIQNGQKDIFQNIEHQQKDADGNEECLMAVHAQESFEGTQYLIFARHIRIDQQGDEGEDKAYADSLQAGADEQQKYHHQSQCLLAFCEKRKYGSYG
jgi:hypothetical protein